MILRPDIRFSSGFPNDSVDGDADIPDVQSGRNIAEALKAALQRRDYRVSDPINGGDHGWELDIWRGRKRFWLQISVLAADECYLLTKLCTLWPDQRLFQAFLSDLQMILEADSRFSQLGWFQSGGIYRRMAPAAGPFDV